MSRTTKTLKTAFVNLTWTAPVSGTPVSYRIERSDGGTSPSWRTVLSDTESSDTNTPDFSASENSLIRYGFTPSGYRKYSFPEAAVMIDERWCYRVRALYADGSEGPPSVSTCIGVIPETPRDPQISHVVKGDTTKEIRMSWTAPSDATPDTTYRLVFGGYAGIRGTQAVSGGGTSLTLTSTSTLGTTLHANIKKLLFGPGEVDTCHATWLFTKNDSRYPRTDLFMSNGDVPCEFRIGFEVYAIRGSDGYVSLPTLSERFDTGTSTGITGIYGRRYTVLTIRAPDEAGP